MLFENDFRLPEYKYWNQLLDHIKDPEIIFSDKFVWPRQFEIHLPGNHNRSCNLNCHFCLLPGETIKVNTIDFKRIEDVSCGDIVVGENGINNVEDVITHHYCGDCVKIKTDYLFSLNCTGNHNVYYYDVSTSTLRTKMAREINVGDVMVVPEIVLPEVSNSITLGSNTITVDEDVAYLLGAYVGDGCVTKNKNRKNTYALSFCLSDYKNIVRDKIINILHNKFKKQTGIAYTSDKAYALYVRRPSDIAILIGSMCGIGSNNKTIPDVIMNGNKSIKEAFLQGYLACDGNYRHGGKQIRAYTVSTMLAYKLSSLVLSLKMLPSISVDNRSSRNLIQGRVVNSHLLYIVSWSSLKTKYNSMVVCINGHNYIKVKVKEIESYDYSGDVYDIKTSGTHSFVAPFLLVKNCAGKLFDKSLGRWENDAIQLLYKLDGAIPYHIYGGAYTEPLMNPYFMTFLATTKATGSHFGIHTNGTMLYDLEVNYGWLTELCRLATDRVDYLSISINAGTNDSFRKVTGARGNELDNALNGIALGLKIREETNAKGPSIRLCYLMSGANATQKDIDAICEFAIEFKVDSLRFSIPFANYNQSFEKVHKYRDNVEQKNKDAYYNMVQKYLSTDESAKPYIFWNGPHFTDVDLYTFDRCAYGYYQITYGADGYVYKCSTVATPTAKQCRIGKVTSDLGEFKNMVVRNYDQKWSCKRGCFDNGVRCNRMGIEINSMIGGNL